MFAKHLKLNLDKIELISLPRKGSPIHDLNVIITSVVSLTQTERILGVLLDNELSFTASISASTRSCGYTLYNIQRLCSILIQKGMQVLV